MESKRSGRKKILKQKQKEIKKLSSSFTQSRFCKSTSLPHSARVLPASSWSQDPTLDQIPPVRSVFQPLVQLLAHHLAFCAVLIPDPLLLFNIPRFILQVYHLSSCIWIQSNLRALPSCLQHILARLFGSSTSRSSLHIRTCLIFFNTVSPLGSPTMAQPSRTSLTTMSPFFESSTTTIPNPTVVIRVVRGLDESWQTLLFFSQLLTHSLTHSPPGGAFLMFSAISLTLLRWVLRIPKLRVFICLHRHQSA